jgi:peptide deformylase
MIYPIVFEPNSILHKRSADVDPVSIATPEMKKFIKDMVETMYVKDGVGLAAVQIGVSKQLCVIAKNFTPDKKKDLCLINPTWVKLSNKQEWDELGSRRRRKKTRMGILREFVWRMGYSYC